MKIIGLRKRTGTQKTGLRKGAETAKKPDTAAGFMTLFFVLGVITGSILNPVGYGDGIGGIPADTQTAAQILRVSVMTLLPFAAGLLLLSLFALGWAVTPLVMAFRGFELGVLFRSLYAAEGLPAGLPYALALLPGAAISGAALILMGAGALKVSLGLFAALSRRSIILDMSALLRGFILKFAGLCVVLVGSALIDVLSRKIYFAVF
ncbi:MAG: hypothetical protein FWE86_05415 [Oscillospiraceae bacterium]|nr:hypothetical protein [Oscillospiraceae bacterium]